MAEYIATVEIDARPDEVFDFLITETGLAAWLGQHAELETHVGGAFAVDIAGYQIRGQYLEIDPPNRVVFSWGMNGNAALPPGASRVEFTLLPTPRGGTRVELVHSGLPQDAISGHAYGWKHFLGRFERVANGINAGPDNWRPLVESGQQF